MTYVQAYVQCGFNEGFKLYIVVMSASDVAEFFDEIIRLLQEADRQYGIANSSYTDYALVRLEHSIRSCSMVRERLEVESNFAASLDLQEYCSMLSSLIVFKKSL